jgi:hypothetical protein
MKHSSIKIMIETEENGYRIERSKMFFFNYDKALLLDLVDEIAKWTKGKSKAIITICGIGTNDFYHEESLFRVIYDFRWSDCTGYTIVTWNGKSTGESTEYSNKKDYLVGLRSQIEKVGKVLVEDEKQ